MSEITELCKTARDLVFSDCKVKVLSLLVEHARTAEVAPGTQYNGADVAAWLGRIAAATASLTSPGE